MFAMYDRYIKRLLDFLFSLVALVLLAPVFVFIMAAIARRRGPGFLGRQDW